MTKWKLQVTNEKNRHMKYTLLLLLIIAFNCNEPKKEKEEIETVKIEEIIPEVEKTTDNSYIKLSKTACSGHCPVYDIVLFKDGTVSFNAIENLAIKGKQEFTISESKMKKIKEMFNKTSFKDYKNNYVDISKMDYPSTFITYNNKQIEIKLWKNVPLELALACEAIEDILLDKKLIE